MCNTKSFTTFNLSKPCVDCPFRKDGTKIGLVLTQERAIEIAESVFNMGDNFPCHKTSYHNDDGEYEYNNKESQCAGAAIMQIKTNNPSRWQQVVERFAKAGYSSFQEDYTRLKNLDLDSPVFDSIQDFIKFHNR